jgi:hypothetical protein
MFIFPLLAQSRLQWVAVALVVPQITALLVAIPHWVTMQPWVAAVVVCNISQADRKVLHLVVLVATVLQKLLERPSFHYKAKMEGILLETMPEVAVAVPAQMAMPPLLA